MLPFDILWKNDEDNLVHHLRVHDADKEGALQYSHKYLIENGIYSYTIFSIQPADPDLL